MLLGAGTLVAADTWSAGAAPGDADATFVPVAPCRLFDYRPAPDTIGPRAAALGPGEVHVQQVTGGAGNCDGPSAIPADAVAVSMNVTIVGPTAQSNLRLYPAELAEPPLASNLNWLAGQSPTPNKVDVKLSPSGAMKLRNANGSVFVLADIVGYFTSASLGELAERTATVESNTSALADRVANLERSQPFARSVSTGGGQIAGLTTIVSVPIAAPVDGHVAVTTSANVRASDTRGEAVRCSISDDLAQDFEHLQEWESGASNGNVAQIAGTRTFPLEAGASAVYRLNCEPLAPTVATTIADTSIVAVFTPALAGEGIAD